MRLQSACHNKEAAETRFGQALWVTLVAMPAILVNIAPASQAALGLKDLIGVGIWAAGFGLEIVADRGEFESHGVFLALVRTPRDSQKRCIGA